MFWVFLLSISSILSYFTQPVFLGNVGKTASMSMLTLFESRYTLKGRYNIGNVSKTASMSMLTLFESRYTLKGRYNIGNVSKTAYMSMLTLNLNQYIH